MKIMIFLLSITLISCATQNISHKIDNPQNDLFKDESYLRFTMKRMPKELKQKEVFLCYQNKYTQAFKLLKSQYQKKKDQASYWNDYGICYFLKKDYIKAEYFFQLSLQYSDNKYLPAYNNLALSHVKRNDMEKAFYYFNKMKSVQLYLPHYNLAQLYLQIDRPKIALDLLLPLYQKNKSDPDVIMSLAITRILLGQTDQARKHIAYLINSNQLDTNKIFYKAMLHYYGKEWGQVIETLKNVHFTKTLTLKRFAGRMMKIALKKKEEQEKSLKKMIKKKG